MVKYLWYLFALFLPIASQSQIVDTPQHVVRVYPVVGDNSSQLQWAINYCQSNSCVIKLAAGTYQVSKPLLVINQQNGDYGASFVDIEGPTDARNGVAGQVARINAQFTDAPLFVLQQAKGATIKNLVLTGQYTKSNNFGWLDVDTLTFNQWKDGRCADNPTSPYAAICIDPFSSAGYFDSTHKMYSRLSKYYYPNMSRSGSTAINIEGCFIYSFVVGIMITPSYQYNGEMIDINKCHIDNCISAIAQTQAQSKVNTVYDCMFWGGVHTIIDGIHWGFGRKDGMTLPYVSACNIAGLNHELVAAYPVNFQSTFDRVYAEGLFKIGDFGAPTSTELSGGTAYYTRSGVVFQNCMFDMQTTDVGIPAPDFYFQGEGVNFIGCTFRLYNGSSYIGRLIFTDNQLFFRDGVFGMLPVLKKTSKSATPGPSYTNMRNYNNPPYKIKDTGYSEIQGDIGKKVIYIDRSIFSGYILDFSHQVRPYDYLLTQRMNDEGWPYAVFNYAYPVGSVSAIKGDTAFLVNMGVGWHNGDSAEVFWDRIKYN